MRALGLAPPPPIEREGELFQASDVPAIRFEHRPGATQRLTYRDAPESPPRVVEMRVNAQGFRGAEVAREPAPGATRIACVGDSHTFGWGVAEGEAWPDHLARELAARRPDARHEVLNCGVNNHDTVQEVAFLEQRVLPYAPDLVLLQMYVNDAAVHGIEPAGQGERDLLLRWTKPDRGGVVGALRARSRALDLVLDGLYRRRGLAVYSARRARLFEDDQPGWRAVQGALVRARDLCAARGARFAVALYPFLVRDGDALTSRAPFEAVRRFCQQERIPCFDLEPAFLAPGVDVDALRVSPQDYHGNARANAIFARGVADALAQQGWLAE